MPLYTFYTSKADSPVAALDVAYLAEDGAAQVQAGAICSERKACVRMEIWRDDILIAARDCADGWPGEDSGAGGDDSNPRCFDEPAGGVDVKDLQFPFSDLRGFRDYVEFVGLCAPDLFPSRQGLGPHDQWTLALAFSGLRHGLLAAERQAGPKAVFADCLRRIDEAEACYRAGDRRAGYMQLHNLKVLLGEVLKD